MSVEQKINILSSQYDDGSGYDVIRCYVSAERAKQDMKLLENVQDGKQYRITELEITK